MDAFESVVRTLLDHQGWLTSQSFKVNLTKEEKRRAGKPTMPRPEIDLLAIKPGDRRCLVLEAKSYLDSLGVVVEHLAEEFDVPTGRFKLFTCANYQQIVLSRLRQQLIDTGLTTPDTTLQLGLVAGNVHKNRTSELSALCESRGWHFISPDDLRAGLLSIAQTAYEHDPVYVTAKLLGRGKFSV